METTGTLSQAMNLLYQQGYTEDFNLHPHGLYCFSRQIDLEPAAFHVDAVYRFEDRSDPDDEAILYAISSDKYKMKGLLVNAYGLYADTLTAEMEQKLNLNNHI